MVKPKAQNTAQAVVQQSSSSSSRYGSSSVMFSRPCQVECIEVLQYSDYLLDTTFFNWCNNVGMFLLKQLNLACSPSLSIVFVQWFECIISLFFWVTVSWTWPIIKWHTFIRIKTIAMLSCLIWFASVSHSWHIERLLRAWLSCLGGVLASKHSSHNIYVAYHILLYLGIITNTYIL